VGSRLDGTGNFEPVPATRFEVGRYLCREGFRPGPHLCCCCLMRSAAGDDDAPVDVFRAALQQLFAQVRRPTYRTLVGHADRGGLVLRTSTIGTLLNGPGAPRWGTVEAFISACARHAQAHRLDLPAPLFDLEQWQARYSSMKLAVAAQAEEAVPDAKRSPRNRTEPVPAQLPADIAGFAGRREHLRQLDELVTGADPKTVVIAAVSGTAGVGKTALAVHWAHTVAHRFPDGQLYVNLRGFDPGGMSTDPAEAVRTLLDGLGVPLERIPPGLDAQAGLYRSLTAGRQLLIVLDNARDTEQVRPLLPAASTCLAVVTSRDTLTGLCVTQGARPLRLDVLPQDEAREMLVRRTGAARVRADPAATREIVTACAGLPLALAIVAARAQQTGFPLAVSAGELRDAGQRLDALDIGDPASQVRAVFSWSYATLGSFAGRLFRLLGLHPGPDVDASAAAALAGHTTAEVRRPLAELVRASLLIEHAPGRYAFHDLLRAYATEQCHAHDTERERHRATSRLLDYYLNTANAGPVATDWFTTERLVLLAAIEHAATSGFDTHAWQLFDKLDDFLYRQGHWHDRIAAGRTAVAAAERLGDPVGRQRTHRLLANAYTELHRFAEAHTHLTHALAAAQTGDHAGLGETHNSMARSWIRQGGHRQALDHARHALDHFQAAGDPGGEAWALNQVGWQNTCSGKHEQALTAALEALRLHQTLGDRKNEATTWDTIGYAHHHLGHYAEAVVFYRNALAVYEELSDRYGEAEVLKHLGETHHATGNISAARNAWQQALNILDDLRHPEADAVRTRLTSSG